MAFIISFVATIFSGLMTYYLSKTRQQGPVRASATMGVLIGLLLYLFPIWFTHPFTQSIPYVMFGGSFIGMVTAERHIRKWTITLSSLVFTVLFSVKSPHFNGLGGLLGITAMLSILTSVGIIIVLNRLSK